MNETNNSQQKKKEFPYIEILKKAGRIVWQNRFLLWFGVLISLGSPGSFNIGNSENWDKNGDAAKSFMEAHWQLVLVIAVVLFVVCIAIFLISLIAKAGLIKSVNSINQNQKTSFRAGWQTGKKYLGKQFKLFLVFFLVVLIMILVLGVPVVYLLVTGSWVSGILVGILAVAIFVPLIFVLALTNIFAEFYIILSDLNVQSAIESGYNLLVKNVGRSLIFGLLLIAVSMAAGLVLLPVAALAALVLIPTGILFFYLNKIAFGFFIALAVFLFLVVVLAISSIFATYKTTAWTLFFQEIASAKTEEAEKVLEEIEDEAIAPMGEKA